MGSFIMRRWAAMDTANGEVSGGQVHAVASVEEGLFLTRIRRPRQRAIVVEHLARADQ